MTTKPHALLLATFAVAAALVATSGRAQPAAVTAESERPQAAGAVYASRCARCHDEGTDTAPAKPALAQMGSDAVFRAITSGPMQPFAVGLSAEERQGLAEFLTRDSRAQTPSAPVWMCAHDASWFDFAQPPAFPSSGFDPANTHSVPTAAAALDASNVGRLKLKWAFAFPGPPRTRAQPALAGGAIFVGSASGAVYALDRDTGCARWVFKARSEVRTGIQISPWRPGTGQGHPTAYFADVEGYVYAVDAVTGRTVWDDRADAHPSSIVTGTPALYRGELFVPVSSTESGTSAADPNYACCTFRGSLVAYDAATGRRRWQTFTIPPAEPRGDNSGGAKRYGPSGASIWNSPTIDEKRGRIYVSTGNNYSDPTSNTSDAVLALDIGSGRILWASQVLPNDAWNISCATGDHSNCPASNGPDYDLGTGTVLAKGKDGRDYIAVGQKSGVLYGLDAESGRIMWRTPIGGGGVDGGFQFGLAAEGGAVIAPLRALPRPNRSPTADGVRGMYAVDVSTGEFIWKAPAENVCQGKPPGCFPGYGAPVAVTPELVLAGSVDGNMRAFDRRSGAILWAFDTAREFRAVNGDIAHGGSIVGTNAPVAYQGMLIVGSGYSGMAGNALLVFSVSPDGRAQTSQRRPR